MSIFPLGETELPRQPQKRTQAADSNEVSLQTANKNENQTDESANS